MSEHHRALNILFFCLALGGLVFALYGAYANWYGPSFASAIASSGLVLATTLSLITTRSTLQEERLSREQQAKPLLRVLLTPVGYGSCSIMVENVGNGPAKDVEVSVQAIDTDGEEKETISADLPTIAPDESIALSTGISEVSKDNFEGFKDGDASQESEGVLGTADQISAGDIEDIEKIRLTGECRDILNHSHDIESTYYTKYMNEGMAQYGSTDTESELKEINRSLTQIDDSISQIS